MLSQKTDSYKLTLNNLPLANLEKLKNPMYLAGAADGLLRSDIKITEGDKMLSVLSAESRTDLPAFWHSYFKCGSLSKNKTNWGLYNPYDCINLLNNYYLFSLLILRRNEFKIFEEYLNKVICYRQEKDYARRCRLFSEVRQLMSQHASNRYNPVGLRNDFYLTPEYLAGLFEASPKGSIGYKKDRTRYKLYVQLGTPYEEFAQRLKLEHNGSIRALTSENITTYIWTASGNFAEAFIRDVLAPHAAKPLLPEEFQSSYAVEQ